MSCPLPPPPHTHTHTCSVWLSSDAPVDGEVADAPWWDRDVFPTGGAHTHTRTHTCSAPVDGEVADSPCGYRDVLPTGGTAQGPARAVPNQVQQTAGAEGVGARQQTGLLGIGK